MNPITHGLRIAMGPDAFPKGFDTRQLNEIMYQLSATNEDSALITETESLAIMDSAYNEGELIVEKMILDAVTAKYNRLPRTMAALQRVFNKHLRSGESDLTTEAPVVGDPRKGSLFATVTVQFPFSDGQVLSVVFHAPGGDARKIVNDDDLIAFRWLINKRDITQVVAPEVESGQARDISLDTVGRRVTQLIAANSERFQKRQAEVAATRKELEEAKTTVETLTDQQQSLTNVVADLDNAQQELDQTILSKQTRLEELQQSNSDLEAQLEGLRSQQQEQENENPDIYVGLTWEGPGVTREVVKQYDSNRFSVAMGEGSRLPQLMSADDIRRHMEMDRENIIFRDKSMEAERKKAQEKEKQKQEKENTYGFIDAMPARFAAKAKKSLIDVPVKLEDGTIANRKKWIEELVRRDGSAIEEARTYNHKEYEKAKGKAQGLRRTMPLGNKQHPDSIEYFALKERLDADDFWITERRLVSSEPGYQDEAVLTKTGMDYAEYLLGNSQFMGQKEEDSPTDQEDIEHTKPASELDEETRKALLSEVWKKAHKDHKSVIDGVRYRTMMTDKGTSLVPLESLTDSQIKEAVGKDIWDQYTQKQEEPDSSDYISHDQTDFIDLHVGPTATPEQALEAVKKFQSLKQGDRFFPIKRGGNNNTIVAKKLARKVVDEEGLSHSLAELTGLKTSQINEAFAAIEYEKSGGKTVVQPAAKQSGQPAKNVARLLHNLKLQEKVMEGEDFHTRLKNEPYQDLVIERHPMGDYQQLYLTHYYEQGGDQIMDAEMVFRISQTGLLTLAETATTSPRGEMRGLDNSFASMFSKNLNNQGFGDATAPGTEEEKEMNAETDTSTEEGSNSRTEQPEAVTTLESIINGQFDDKSSDEVQDMLMKALEELESQGVAQEYDAILGRAAEKYVELTDKEGL